MWIHISFPLSNDKSFEMKLRQLLFGTQFSNQRDLFAFNLKRGRQFPLCLLHASTHRFQEFVFIMFLFVLFDYNVIQTSGTSIPFVVYLWFFLVCSKCYKWEWFYYSTHPFCQFWTEYVILLPWIPCEPKYHLYDH